MLGWRFEPLLISRWAADADDRTHTVDTASQPFSLPYEFRFACHAGKADVQCQYLRRLPTVPSVTFREHRDLYTERIALQDAAVKPRYRRHLGVLLAVVALLLVARAVMPYVVKHYLNARMDTMGDYHGQIADIDIHLWRGAYSIDQLRIVKQAGKVPVPLLEAPRTDIKLSWRALTHGSVRGKVAFFRPVLNFVDGRGRRRQPEWQGRRLARRSCKLLAPIRLDEVSVSQGTVTFQNFVSSPRVDLKMTDVNATASNLTNVDGHQAAACGQLQATAKVLGQAPLETHATLRSAAGAGRFHLSTCRSAISS